jgi:hypothetical protein
MFCSVAIFAPYFKFEFQKGYLFECQYYPHSRQNPFIWIPVNSDEGFGFDHIIMSLTIARSFGEQNNDDSERVAGYLIT